MRNLRDYVLAIEEGRRPKNVEGKTAEQNGSDGLYETEPPKDDSAVVDIPQEQLNKNMKRLLMKFRTEEDFFIVGRAGWGKTSIIKKLCGQFDRKCQIVMLDKAVASDLGGIPVPGKTKGGHGKQEMLMPDWAAEMAEDKDQKWLLFLDEFNQADPNVMNAVMPIVLEHEICRVKFDNFFVGAAGNFEDENDAVNEMSGPLKSRFKPIITWQTDWISAFSHLHKEWDELVGKDFVDLLQANAELFENPREVDQKIIRFAYRLKESGKYSEFEVEDFYERLIDLAAENIGRAGDKELKKVAEFMFNYVNGKTQGPKKTSRNKGMDMVSDVVKNAIRYGMQNGYLTQEEAGKRVKYGISRENITKVIDSDECNAEMLERIIAKFEADGVKFKFQKDSEWKKLGYKDPDDPDEV